VSIGVVGWCCCSAFFFGKGGGGELLNSIAYFGKIETIEDLHGL